MLVNHINVGALIHLGKLKIMGFMYKIMASDKKMLFLSKKKQSFSD